MNVPFYSHQQLVSIGRFSLEDMNQINQRRRVYNRLGFGYQLIFVRLTNRYPSQRPFEVEAEILTFAGLQLDISPQNIQAYIQRQQTISHHQELIRLYLNLRRFREAEKERLGKFLFEEAQRIEHNDVLLAQGQQFLKAQRILQPADDTLQRLIAHHRKQANQDIYERIKAALLPGMTARLDALLATETGRSPLLSLKQPAGKAAPGALLRLIDKLEQIKATGILDIDLAWLNNNYQRSLTRYARRCSAHRLRELTSGHRYTALICFLRQVHADTIDHIIDMHAKLMTGIYNRAQNALDEQSRKRRKMFRRSLATLRTLGEILLDETVDDAALRDVVFSKVAKTELTAQMEDIEIWLSGKYSHVFNLVKQRFSYLRQFAPALLEHIQFQDSEGSQSSLAEGIEILREMNRKNKRKLPDDVPLNFIPKTIRSLIINDGVVDRPGWECAVMTAVRDQVRAGNLFVAQSKRFARFDDFFISDTRWRSLRTDFFRRAGLPEKVDDVPDYLDKRLNLAYEQCLSGLPENTYARVDEAGWHLSIDPAEKLDSVEKERLAQLKSWLGEQMRLIKLPDLLIEVDNELQFTRHFMNPARHNERQPEDICAILATLIAHGCNIGPYTMGRLAEGISYWQIKQVTDWQLTEEAQRSALAKVVNAISRLDVSRSWGQGKTSSSDGQRFRFKRKVLQRTYSHRFGDYALEFYSFVADNYAPFYSAPIECTDRDAAYILDGLLYNESDLALEEHYVDTHGYTEINFAAFAMLGRRFSPRIRGLKAQRIYRIDPEKDYGPLSVLVDRSDRTVHMDWICEQWDRMGQFYTSLENGHTTASTALKRLVAFSSKNHFYRANRELGRVFKTEHILTYMTDPLFRRRIRRGLLKGEEFHALAREVAYGKQGRITTRDLDEQKNTSSCLTLIMACLIYWQAKEINRVIEEHNPVADGIDVSLIEHVSPIGWDNVILYGEYVLNRNLVKP